MITRVRVYLHLGGAAGDALGLGSGGGRRGCASGSRMLRRVGLGVAVDDAVGPRGPGPAARMPDRRPLQEHLLAVAEGIAAFGAARARRMEVVILAGLQHLAAYVAITVGALHAELLLVVSLAIRHAVSEGWRVQRLGEARLSKYVCVGIWDFI